MRRPRFGAFPCPFVLDLMANHRLPRVTGRPRPAGWDAAVVRPLTNFFAFYAIWGASVWGAATGLPWAGPAALLAWVVPHLAACGQRRGRELRLLLAAGATGYGVDSALVVAGWLEFPAEARLGSPSTLWMVGLWVGLAATLRHSFRLVLGRPALAAVLGAAGAPFAYWSGARFGAVSLADGALVAVGLAWAVAMPWLAWLAADRPWPPPGTGASRER